MMPRYWWVHVFFVIRLASGAGEFKDQAQRIGLLTGKRPWPVPNLTDSDMTTDNGNISIFQYIPIYILFLFLFPSKRSQVMKKN